MRNSAEPLVIVIAGPTGSGKTALSLRLAEHLRTVIISADSRQCYREMTIGTAKPPAEDLALITHYFINSHSIHHPATAFDFERYALDKLEHIFQARNTAIVCGGTGLYIQALCEGLNEMPQVDESIEKAVNSAYLENGREWLKEAVATEDPEFYAQAEIENPARLLRALAFRRSTGRSIVHFQTGTSKKRSFKILKITLALDRQALYRHINQRVDKMMAAGLLEEAAALYPQRHLKALNTVGYVELFDYFDGHYSLEKAVDLIKQHSRNYAKRQLTWFRKDKSFHWLAPDDYSGILRLIESEAGCGGQA
ncbi:MAG TPA: tRNA (adenosine(37)-N6)-dimethylallyltransferase MiaA [Edaphocola sp.]|nr:tRNA (adenosine(37)-N6)-dimethylallyltransferase MiaA [Edaphocola sp.]